MGDPGDSRRLLFAVPVHRLSREGFYDEQNGLMAPHIEQLQTYLDETEAWVLASQAVKWKAWDFNDLVGWVTIHGYHDMVKMYLWWTTAKQIRRDGHHVYECLGKFTETLLDEEMSNEEIGAHVREKLVSTFQNEPKSRRSRHLNLSTFDAISPWLDWRAALAACEQRAAPGG